MMRQMVAALSAVLGVPPGLDWKPFDEVRIDGSALGSFVDLAMMHWMETPNTAYRQLIGGVLGALVVLSRRCGNSHDVDDSELISKCEMMDLAMGHWKLQ
jgi:hypothetical protein